MEEAESIFSDDLSITQPDPITQFPREDFLHLGYLSNNGPFSSPTPTTQMSYESSVHDCPLDANAWHMKTTESKKHKDTMRPEYDMRGAVRGKYAGQFKGTVVRVSLEPDIAETFPDDASVNEALRLLIKAAKKATSVAGCPVY